MAKKPVDNENVASLFGDDFEQPVEAVPELKSKRKDKKNPRISIWEFTSQGIPLKVWKDKKEAQEAAEAEPDAVND